MAFSFLSSCSGCKESLRTSTLLLGNILDWGPPGTDFQPKHHNWLLPVKLHMQTNFPSNGNSVKLSFFCTVPKVFPFLREKSPASASKPISMGWGARPKQKTSHNVRRTPLSASGNAYFVGCLAYSLCLCATSSKSDIGIWNPECKVRHSLQIHIIWPVVIPFFFFFFS